MPDPSLLAQLLDRQEITAVMAAYTRWADLNRPEEQAATCTDDCRVSYHPDDWIVGRAALTSKLRTALAGYAQTSHHLSNIEIDFQGPDSATAQSAVIAWHRRHDGTEWTLYGRYVDRWTRSGDGWRLAERELRAAGATGRDDRQLPPLGRASGADLSRPAIELQPPLLPLPEASCARSSSAARRSSAAASYTCWPGRAMRSAS